MEEELIMYQKNILFSELQNKIDKNVLETWFSFYLQNRSQELVLPNIKNELRRLSAQPDILQRTILLVQELFWQVAVQEIRIEIIELLLKQATKESIRGLVNLLVDPLSSELAYELVEQKLPKFFPQVRVTLGAECYRQLAQNQEELVPEVQERLLNILAKCRHTVPAVELEDNFLAAQTIQEQALRLRVIGAVGGSSAVTSLINLFENYDIPQELERDLIVALGILREAETGPILLSLQKKYRFDQELKTLVRATLRRIYS
jgi:hypothetical protein